MVVATNHPMFQVHLLFRSQRDRKNISLYKWVLLDIKTHINDVEPCLSSSFLFSTSLLGSELRLKTLTTLHRSYTTFAKYDNVSKNSTYFTNLKKLLSSLSSPNASYSTGFQNATAGQAPDRVTGIFLYRGDLSPEVCRNCVALSVQETLVRCPNGRESILYYEECMLRYSHQNILSTLTYNRVYYKLNPNNISSDQADRFQDVVSFTMNKAAVEAANSSRKFFTLKANWTAFQTLFVLVQCTPDLTRYECLRCLQKSINYNPLNIIGARLFRPSCNSRYELYAFYNETAVRTPPLPASTSRVSSPPRPGKNGTTKVLAIAIFVAIIVGVLLFIAGYLCHAKKKKKTSDAAQAFDGNEITTIESLQLDYRIIQAATNNYSESNKIGEGGYGEVYKGTLFNGAEVAVKKLSKSAGQGATDFMNEVVVVAKLQHKNLVRLLGFSLNREEKILVYEYVPNKSLDYFLFDHANKGKLDWTQRYKIIEGISRGMLYLHRDSRLTVIHRDLKASNILLDVDMNPKIADFGMARIFGVNQTQDNTSRIVGTYGYMSPEYAMCGQFSIKSDVYSFGVLVLEILSGRKNNSFHETDHAHDLLTYAWRLWIDSTALDLMDPIIFDNCKKSEMARCIHIGLLCVQEDPLDRPTFSTILMMLTSYNMTLPVPQQPGFFSHCRPEKDPLDSNKSMTIMSVPGSIGDTSSSSKW